MKVFVVSMMIAASLSMPLPYSEHNILLPEMKPSATTDTTICADETETETPQKEEKVKKQKEVKKCLATENVSLPTQSDNSFKSYMDWRMITDNSSKQWEMQQQAYTDENGLRKIGDYYCVALGSGISDTLGTKFIATLDSGEKIKIIMAEQKSDRHTDESNRYMPRDDGSINLIEFIVQTERLPEIVTIMGDISYISGNLFFGNIVRMEEIKDEESAGD